MKTKDNNKDRLITTEVADESLDDDDDDGLFLEESLKKVRGLNE